METTNRYFYKCPECLIVVALDGVLYNQLYCDTCRIDAQRAAIMQFMGRVEGNKLVHEYERTPCDDRCTYARGPACDCSCCGRNHGSHKVVSVRIVNDIPIACAPQDAGKYRQQAEDFRALLDAARMAIIEKGGGVEAVDKFNYGVWLPRPQWEIFYYGFKSWNKARVMRDHKARMKALQKIIDGAATSIAA